MKLSEKIISLRKANSISQEDLAERLNVSRQAVSRWESGSVTPDAAHVLQLSRLFGVSCDYLLDDELQSTQTVPDSRCKKSIDTRFLSYTFIALEICVFILQMLFFIIMKHDLFGALSLILMVLLILAYEYRYRLNISALSAEAGLHRRRFYLNSTWIATYFPIRIAVTAAMSLYPRPYSSILLEALILFAYAVINLIVFRAISKLLSN